jgi:Flp pilus assembly pilin Flp
VEAQPLVHAAMSHLVRVAHALRLTGCGRGRALAGGRIRNKERVSRTTTRLKERDVMNLKNITYYLRAKLGLNESGQDLLEYALLVALIALVSVGVITSAGTGVKSIFTDISSELTKANP